MPSPRARVRSNAFTLLEVIVIIVVVTTIFALVIPRFARSRMRSSKLGCANQLKQIGLAFRVFANDNDDLFPTAVSTNNGGVKELEYASEIALLTFQSMSNELTTPAVLICPHDSARTRATNWTTDFRSGKAGYFVGLDSTVEHPQSLLSGDRNLMVDGVPLGKGLTELTTNRTVGWTAAIHANLGYVLLGDGSVQSLDKRRLQEQLGQTGFQTNRVAIP
jgi:competence protein ComGC